MACSSRRQINESSSRSSIPANMPQFFKIMHDGIVHDPKLRIPGEFVKNYGNHLPNPVFLNVPSGAVWEMELVHSKGAVWLKNGWQEFKESYSIRYGHILVFRYDGNSHFHVLILDMSAIEIEYPTKRTTSKTMPYCEAMTINRTIKTENTTDGEALFPDFQSRPIQTNGVKLAKSNADGDSKCLKREIKKECIGGMALATTRRHLHTKAPSADEKERALQGAKAYKSEDPFFVVFMQPSYVSDRFNLNIPLAFAREYLAPPQQIVLRASSGRTWSVKCFFGQGHAKAKLTSGWKSFVQDNHLKIHVQSNLKRRIVSIKPSRNDKLNAKPSGVPSLLEAVVIHKQSGFVDALLEDIFTCVSTFYWSRDHVIISTASEANDLTKSEFVEHLEPLYFKS